MFDATKKALDRTIEDFLFADFLRIVVSALVYMATLVYRIILGNLLGLYIPLLAITAAYLIEYLAFTKWGKNLKMTGAKKRALVWYRWTKRAFTLAVIVITVASLVETATAVTPLAVIFAVFSAVCLVLQILFDLIGSYIKRRFQLIREGVKEDIDEITRIAQPIIRPIRFIQRLAMGRKKQETSTPIATPSLQAEEAVTLIEESAPPASDDRQEDAIPQQKKRGFFARLFKKKTPPLAVTVEEEKENRKALPAPKEEVGKDGITYLVAEYSPEKTKKK